MKQQSLPIWCNTLQWCVCPELQCFRNIHNVAYTCVWLTLKLSLFVKSVYKIFNLIKITPLREHCNHWRLQSAPGWVKLFSWVCKIVILLMKTHFCCSHISIVIFLRMQRHVIFVSVFKHVIRESWCDTICQMRSWLPFDGKVELFKR